MMNLCIQKNKQKLYIFFCHYKYIKKIGGK